MLSLHTLLVVASVLGLSAAVPAPSPVVAGGSCIPMCVTPTVTAYPTEIHCPIQPVIPGLPCPRYQCIKEPLQTATSTHFCHGTSCEGLGLPTTSCDSLPPVTVLGNPCYTGCPIPCPVSVTTVGEACPVKTA